MSQRLNYSKVAPDGVEVLRQLEKYVRSSGPESDLIELAVSFRTPVGSYQPTIQLRKRIRC